MIKVKKWYLKVLVLSSLFMLMEIYEGIHYHVVSLFIRSLFIVTIQSSYEIGSLKLLLCCCNITIYALSGKILGSFLRLRNAIALFSALLLACILSDLGLASKDDLG